MVVADGPKLAVGEWRIIEGHVRSFTGKIIAKTTWLKILSKIMKFLWSLILSMDFQVAIQTQNFLHFPKLNQKLPQNSVKRLFRNFRWQNMNFEWLIFSFESSNQEPLHQHTQTDRSEPIGKRLQEFHHDFFYLLIFLCFQVDRMETKFQQIFSSELQWIQSAVIKTQCSILRFL